MKILKTSFPIDKKVLIVGGLHGDELTPFILLERIYKSGNHPRNLNVTIIPFFNLVGLKARKHEDPDLGKDINRLFSEGSEVLRKYPEFEALLSEADIVIDFHTHQYTKTLPYSVIFSRDPDLQSLVKNLSIKFIEFGDPKKDKERIENTLINYVNKIGKKGVIVETSNLEDLSQDELLDLETRVLNFLNGDSFEDRGLKEIFVQKAESDVIIVEYFKQLGDVVEIDERICRGMLVDSGDLVEVAAKESGTIVTLPKKTFMKKGFSLIKIAK